MCVRRIRRDKPFTLTKFILLGEAQGQEEGSAQSENTCLCTRVPLHTQAHSAAATAHNPAYEHRRGGMG